jgi:HAE1 family hydrophobic/amphiphilic exporter-1
MEALARMATRRPVAITVLAAAMVMIGWVAWQNLPRDLLPDIESPTVVISVRSQDRPPTEMERVYGERIERLLFAVRGIREIKQVARTGRIVASVVFDWGTDMDLAEIEVQKAMSVLAADPDLDDAPTVRRFDPRQSPVLRLGLTAPSGTPDLAELRQLARRQLAPTLEQLEGIAEAKVIGGRVREVQVLIDRYQLEAHDLTIGSVAARLAAANVDIAAGTLEEEGRTYLVRGLSRFESPDDIRKVVLRYDRDSEGRQLPLILDDLAEVEWRDAEISHLTRVDGVEGVSVAIYKEAGSNTVAVSRRIREALDDIERDMPGVEVEIVSDEATMVEESLDDLQSSALIGIGLSILVLVVFLRALAPTLIVSTAVPVALFTAFFFMDLAGQTLNLMTIAGLALGAGNFVDNAIVVVESMFRRLQAGIAPAEAAAQGAGEVGPAIAASTLTACIVFLPVIFVEGLAARLVEGLAFTVTVSMLAALAAAVLLIPALSRWLLPRHGVQALDVGSVRVERIVTSLLSRPWLVLAVATLLTTLAYFQLQRLGTELLPPADPRQFSVRLVAPAGTRVEAMSETVATVEALIREAAAGAPLTILSEIGRLPEDDRLIREEQTEEHTARITVRAEAQGPTGSQIVQAASPAVARFHELEAQWEVGSSALSVALGSSGPPVVIELSGQSLTELEAASRELDAALSSRAELWNVQTSFEGGPPELRVRLRRSLADGLGVDLDQVSASLQAALDGKLATTVVTGDEQRDVVLRMPPVRRADLAQMPLTSTSGARITLGDVASFEPAEGAKEVYRRDQRRVVQVTARIAQGYDYPQAIAAGRAVLEQQGTPPGVITRFSGEEQERQQVVTQLAWAGLLALVLVLMVLAGTFESLLHPLTVLSIVPMSLCGVAIAMVPLGEPLGVMAMLGLIVLVGVAVNDSILLVDAVQGLQRSGLSLSQALARAAAIRLRPILMTSLTTILALLPLAFGTSDSATLRRPLAMTVIGGMVASIVGSLFVVPCLYLVLERLRWKR